MTINFQDLKNLIVKTESGQALGKIVDVEINAEDHRITKYRVVDKKFMKSGGDCLIAPEQVVEINNECVIVKDSAVNQEASNENKRPIALGNPASVNAEIEMQ